MSEWQKINWREAAGKVVFDDEWGFVEVGGDISYSVGNVALNNLYEDDAKGQKVKLSIDENNPQQIASLFSKTLYGYLNDAYSYQRRYVNVAVDTMDVHVYGPYNYNHRWQETFKIRKKDKKRLEYLRYVWTCDELQNSETASGIKNLKPPLLKNLKTGDCFFCDKGKCKILKFYPQPNENNLMFQAVRDFEACDKDPFDVAFDYKFFVLPYEEQPISEFKQFNESKNEIWLSPYAEQGHTWEYGSSVSHGYSKIHCVNVFWNKIDAAADYIVSLYKQFDRPYLQRVYHLKDYVVDRNDGFLVINDLLGDGYIITVKAENRNGEEIALSRGISVGGRSLPQYFKE